MDRIRIFEDANRRRIASELAEVLARQDVVLSFEQEPATPMF